jgi:hypothetical protein
MGANEAHLDYAWYGKAAAFNNQINTSSGNAVHFKDLSQTLGESPFAIYCKILALSKFELHSSLGVYLSIL